MSGTSDTIPQAPRQPVAPDTDPTELRRLALQEASHADCRPLAVQALIWLFRAYSTTVTAQAEELRPLGLSPSAFSVLMSLHNTPGHTLEPCEIAERLLVSRPSVTGLLDTLQAKGLIERHAHPDDGRRLHIVLTDTGRDLLGRHFATHYARLDEILADFSDDELAQLVTLLRRVRRAAPPDLAPSLD